MAELSTLARPYARAAFEYARDKGDLDAWLEQLATAAAVTQQDAMQALLNDPALTAERQAEVMDEVCGDSLTGEKRNFVAILADNKRLPLLPEIYEMFAQFKANQEKSVDVEVISAFDLEQTIQDKLSAGLSKKLERDIKVSSTTDASLLGGIVIRAGDLVIDGSVRGRLNKLAEAMNS
ncbi:MAG: F0F1 ATP synthase subunit delta [Pseudomonadota bacterium]